MENREFKFRAWDKTLSMWASDGWKMDNLGRVILHSGPAFSPDYVIEQYTGLKDRNGKEIYDGDVVMVGTYGHLWAIDRMFNPKQGDILIVKWLGSGFNLSRPSVQASPLADTPNASANVDNYALWCGQRDVEVIGNIHENPDLLEKRNA